jgi:hypothetical protein
MIRTELILQEIAPGLLGQAGELAPSFNNFGNSTTPASLRAGGSNWYAL